MKNKLIITALAIVLSAALVGGYTMAWFTDSDTAGQAQFTAGTVKVSAGYSADIETIIAGNIVTLVDGPRFASEVVKFEQGKRNDNTDVLTERSDPTVVLEDNNDFVSLGFGGKITVMFDKPIVNFVNVTVDVAVAEVTGGSYPEERARVYASQDEITWVYLGDATNQNRSGNYASNELSLGSLPWAKYIKLVDVTNSALHNDVADGFDILNIKALHGYIDYENINPGDCKPLKYTINNDGTKAITVRMLPDARWLDPELSNDNVTIKLCEGMGVNWEIVGNTFNPDDPDNYEIYYIGPAIGSGNSVDLCLKVCFDGLLTDDDYQGMKLVFGGTVEAVQASHNASEAIGWAR